MAKKVGLKIGRTIRQFAVIEKPYPHILVPSRKELHGWWKGKRECTGERMLANPYNGCSVGCIFCYARALPAAYFRLFNDTGIVTVFEDFDRAVADQLDSLRVASCGYLSPVCDPFQAVDSRYRLSEKIVREFVSRNIPIEFITKCVVPRSVIDLMKTQAHSFGQFSLSTPNEGVRSQLMKRGASVEQIFSSMTECAVAGLPVVLRIDPVVPFLTDSKADLRQLVDRGIDSGARHVITSVMDIPTKIAKEVFAKFNLLGVGFGYDLVRVYTEQIDGYLHASIEYRKRIFDVLRNLCEARGITFALCMEYELAGDRPVGLNREFMSSTNCEGTDVPVYVKRAGRFEPAAECAGACLGCMEASCGIDDLAMGKGGGRTDFTLRDYRRWSRNLEGRDG
ncbi:MAG: radical SAM protein [Candidatus Eisenbacteria bacterium]